MTDNQPAREAQTTEGITIRDAILKAADHIEQNPKDFNFGTVTVPHTCGSPGCALGWIHHFAGIKGHMTAIGEELIEATLLDPMLEHDCDFYDRMDEVAKADSWRYRPAECASALRTYAEKYHAAD